MIFGEPMTLAGLSLPETIIYAVLAWTLVWIARRSK
jgi:hypothetical protein